MLFNKAKQAAPFIRADEEAEAAVDSLSTFGEANHKLPTSCLEHGSPGNSSLSVPKLSLSSKSCTARPILHALSSAASWLLSLYIYIPNIKEISFCISIEIHFILGIVVAKTRKIVKIEIEFELKPKPKKKSILMEC